VTMKKLLLVLFVIILSFPVFSQFRNYPLKAGLHFSLLDPYTEFYESRGLKFSTYSRAFVRFELGEKTEAEIGGGYIHYAGLDKTHKYYSSNLYPADIRIIYNPFVFEDFNPFIYGGFGILYSHNVDKPAMVSPLPVNKDVWTGMIPLGLGVEYRFSDYVFSNISIGFTQSFTSSLNYFKEDDKGISSSDGFFSIGLGLTFVVAPSNKDKDNDGIPNSDEELLGSDPLNPDTDGDKLNDGDEVQKYKTNPLKADSDGDGLSDYDEVMKYKTDPNKPDTDGDGLNDGDEVLKYKTDPLNPDTDGDGLKDSEEVSTYNTNPLNADTDGDGLKDGEEVLKYKTDPLKADTDNGSVSDGNEVSAGTDPLNPKDDVVQTPAPAPKEEKAEVPEEVKLEGIVFATGKFVITPEALKILQRDLDVLQKNKDINFEIAGYTDDRGSREMNIKLSEQRANTVLNWFAKNGVEKSRMSAKGYGPDKPAASNDTPEGRQKNRRIGLKVTGK
ncbi:MAG: OmpA family protein, partial [Syntrophothermus sp.]